MPALPTTTSLRVVAALAQHGTVTATAEAVHLTQSAVSKQLRAIEALVGMPLFVRARHGLMPTEAGMIYIEQARIALGAIETAALRTERLHTTRPLLRLHVLPILGDRWFMSRLPRFTARQTGIDVQFVTFAPRETFREVDVVFRFGDGNWPGWKADYFLGREILLVGAPQLLADGAAVKSIEDVARHRLLVHGATPIHWSDFFASHGGTVPAEALETAFGYYSLVIRAAIGGQGLALVPRSLIVRELETGELVNPAGLGFTGRNCYWLTTPAERERTGELGLFCDWVLAEAKFTERRRPELIPGGGAPAP